MTERTLYVRHVPDALLREAKARAAREGRSLGELVIDAVAAAVARPPAPVAGSAEARFERDVRWFEENAAGLEAEYAGQIVAIVDGRVVDHGPDFGEVAERVFAEHGSGPVFMPRVGVPTRTAGVRGPRRPRR